MAVPIAALVLGGTTACATKKFVRTSVGEVNDKVDTLGRSVEETQERTRQNETRIADVDQRAQAGITAANQAASAADQKAVAADQKAAAAGQSASQANTRAGEAGAAAMAAGARAEAVDKFTKRMVYEVVLSEDQGNFKFAKTELPDEAKAKLDEMVTQIKADPKGAYFEIEGHTDNVGTAQVNEKIGMERAEAVKRYLYEQHQIPLHKMNVISYGETKPVAPNNNRDGRAQNRRVVIKVLV
jgi:outer membrane protein OmpA-like peptidoglycan-associated protein